jgi:hypothetical protein
MVGITDFAASIMTTMTRQCGPCAKHNSRNESSGRSVGTAASYYFNLWIGDRM